MKQRYYFSIKLIKHQIEHSVFINRNKNKKFVGLKQI